MKEKISSVHTIIMIINLLSLNGKLYLLLFISKFPTITKSFSLQLVVSVFVRRIISFEFSLVFISLGAFAASAMSNAKQLEHLLFVRTQYLLLRRVYRSARTTSKILLTTKFSSHSFHKILHA